MTATIQLCCAADTILCCNVSLEIEDRKEWVMNIYIYMKKELRHV